MRVGIIAEGISDIAVITNLLKGRLGISRADVQALVPELEYDETSLHTMRKEQFSNWILVKQNCINRKKISEYVESVDEPTFIIIHIDGDMRNEKGFDVVEPKALSNQDDITSLRQNIALKLAEWLNQEYLSQIAFAIALQEIDAWVLTIYGEEETDWIPNAKERLDKVLNKWNGFSKKERSKLSLRAYEKYDFLSEAFRKNKTLATCLHKNKSLAIFCNHLDEVYHFIKHTTPSIN